MPLGVRSIGTVRPGAAKCIPLSCTLVLTGCSTQSSALCPIPLHLQANFHLQQTMQA